LFFETKLVESEDDAMKAFTLLLRTFALNVDVLCSKESNKTTNVAGKRIIRIIMQRLCRAGLEKDGYFMGSFMGILWGREMLHWPIRVSMRVHCLFDGHSFIVHKTAEVP
jgi:hypothetical protein